jgi:hypothetical protein
MDKHGGVSMEKIEPAVLLTGGKEASFVDP